MPHPTIEKYRGWTDRLRSIRGALANPRDMQPEARASLEAQRDHLVAVVGIVEDALAEAVKLDDEARVGA